MKVVWLASWFPTEDNPLSGDFIERHAKAASLYTPVHVFHVSRTKQRNIKSGPVKKNYESYPQLTVNRYYYKILPIPGSSFISYCYSLLLYAKLVRRFIKENGKPDLIHVHVTLRCGLTALFFKFFYQIPFIVTEHFAGFMPEAKQFVRGNPIKDFFMKMILKNSSAVTAVSKALGNALQQKFSVNNIICVPNVVDTNIFFPVKKIETNGPKIFLHVSTLTPQKNPGQMLKAFALLKHEFADNFFLWIVGPPSQHLVELSKQLNIYNCVTWHEETSQQNLARLMQKADALVLYSIFESFGCVNIEAMACGLPVIVSDLPVFREYFHEGVTAYFAQGESPYQLASTLHTFIKSPTISRETVSQYAFPFNYQNVGAQIHDVYCEVLDKISATEKNHKG